MDEYLEKFYDEHKFAIDAGLHILVGGATAAPVAAVAGWSWWMLPACAATAWVGCLARELDQYRNGTKRPWDTWIDQAFFSVGGLCVAPLALIGG